MTMPPLTPADFVRGNRDAPVVIVHYGDFECPYSRALHLTLRELETRLGDKIAIVFRQFPLSDIHPHALDAAVAAQAAGDKFWELHDILFEHQENLREEDLLRYAREIELDSTVFRSELESPATLEAVQESVKNAKELGIHGTPSVFINGKFYDNREGLWKMSRLLPLVEAALTSS